ncbi:MAG TPA: acVLRF1 family peptidyl-tRNA hydrolase [Actinomycetales bacterium]|nr:acVLRF1 family peptidyl-tRNA hydrolase [Actinomycetales bacterium]
MSHRLVEVPADRLERWVIGFGERHGAVAARPGLERVRLQAADGALAELEVPWRPWPVPSSADTSLVVRVLVRHVLRSRTLGLLLVRRGGWAVGTCRDGQVLTHKAGSRYVQSRTAAGGWSQQRYARRRTGQADALAGSVVEASLDRLRADGLDGLVVGGDRQLVRVVLDDRRLAALAALPRSPLLEVPDPKGAVLAQVARRTLAIRVRITD